MNKLKSLLWVSMLTLPLVGHAQRNVTVEVESDCFSKRTQDNFKEAGTDEIKVGEEIQTNKVAHLYLRMHKYMRYIKGKGSKAKYMMFDKKADKTLKLNKKYKPMTLSKAVEVLEQAIGRDNCNSEMMGKKTRTKYSVSTCRPVLVDPVWVASEFDTAQVVTKDWELTSSRRGIRFQCLKTTKCKLTEEMAVAYHQATDKIAARAMLPEECR